MTDSFTAGGCVSPAVIKGWCVPGAPACGVSSVPGVRFRCGVSCGRLRDHGEECGFGFNAALHLLKLRDPFFKLSLCLPLLLCRQLFGCEGADVDGALLVFHDERGANGKAECFQPVAFHLYLRDRGAWAGAGVQDAAALVVAVGVNDFDVLCLHRVSSLDFYFPLPPPVFRAGGALGSVINHSEAVK